MNRTELPADISSQALFRCVPDLENKRTLPATLKKSPEVGDIALHAALFRIPTLDAEGVETTCRPGEARSDWNLPDISGVKKIHSTFKAGPHHLETLCLYLPT